MYLRLSLGQRFFNNIATTCLLTAIILVSQKAFAQEQVAEIAPPKKKSLISFFKKSNYVIAPIVSYQPETSWQFGVGVKYLYRPKNYDSSKTRISFVAASAQYTLKNQILVSPYFVHFFNKEKYMLDGTYSYKKFPQNFFGVGHETPISNKELVDLTEVKAGQIVFRKIKGKLFAGAGLRLLSSFDVSQRENGLLVDQQPVGWDGYTSYGATLNIRLDSRDNILNPSKGEYLDITLENMSKAQANTEPYRLLKINTRKYVQPFGKSNGILAGQFFLQSTLEGDPPFSELAFVGNDIIMRGYYARRYIDRHFVGGQVEYRYPLPYNFGIVAFAGIGDVANTFDNFQVKYLKYSIGTGLRYKIIPKENINVRFDVGFGRGSHSFYLNIAEAF